MALRHHWKLEDNDASTTILAATGTTLVSPNGLLGGDNTSAKHSSSTPGGLILGSMIFNGVDDYIDILSASPINSFTSGQAWSLGVWIKTVSASSAVQICGRTNGASQITRLSANVIRVRMATSNYDFTIPTIPDDTWVYILVTHSTSNALRLFMGISGSAVAESSTGALTAAESFGPQRMGNGQSGAIFHDGHMSWIKWYDSDESANVETHYAEGQTSESISITNISADRIYQRNTNNAADITISGDFIFTGTAPSIWAKLGTRPAKKIVDAPTGTTYSGTLTSQTAGRKRETLIVYFEGREDIEATVLRVGVGDLIVVAGQSNNSGRATNNQISSNLLEEDQASNFKNNDTWATLVDPFDISTGSIDDVSDDTATGSWIIPYVDGYMDKYGVTVGVIPCAKGGSPSEQWMPDYAGDLNLYESMIRRINAVGGSVAFILWWQGESDALNNVTQLNYYNNMKTIANSAYAATGARILNCKIQDTVNDDTKVNAAIQQLWNEGITRRGPDLSSIIFSPDRYHATTDEEIDLVWPLWLDFTDNVVSANNPADHDFSSVLNMDRKVSSVNYGGTVYSKTITDININQDYLDRIAHRFDDRKYYRRGRS